MLNNAAQDRGSLLLCTCVVLVLAAGACRASAAVTTANTPGSAVSSDLAAQGSFNMLTDNEQRAIRYLKTAAEHVRTLKETEWDEESEDVHRRNPYKHSWLASQQLYAAVELGSSLPYVMRGAATLSIVLLTEAGREPEEAIITIQEVTNWCHLALAQNSTLAPAFARRLKKVVGLEDQDMDLLDELIRELDEYPQRPAKQLPSGQNTDSSKSGDTSNAQLVAETSSELLRVHPRPVPSSLPNPVPHRNCDSAGTCEEPQVPAVPLDAPPAALLEAATSMLGVPDQHALWPSRVATLHLNLPQSFHDLIAEKAIARFLKYQAAWIKDEGNADNREDLNNGFFEDQPKMDSEMETETGLAWWPELYGTQEYRLLRAAAKEACVQHAYQNGRPQDLDYLRSLQLNMWAAVYHRGVKHSVHVHEQSVCSGVYYARSPADKKTPFIMVDPRGLQSNHVHPWESNVEPEAPFHQLYAFYPNTGDMVLFPSYVPHRVPAHHFEDARVAFAFNLEGNADAWTRLNI